jgi:hypothetical protein
MNGQYRNRRARRVDFNETADFFPLQGVEGGSQGDQELKAVRLRRLGG